ncbi:hypothetical protein KUV47_05945 [Vannielia litorea]|uniref:hypothetical protein n=1 Tax=Vannielia litorea TaxID=1217970 RepID=UPI001C945F25|nr:hypothetical protein [Vannielia litorea]MBY6152746.1 hypothetical protein [Vannielia litorea]
MSAALRRLSLPLFALLPAIASAQEAAEPLPGPLAPKIAQAATDLGYRVSFRSPQGRRPHDGPTYFLSKDGFFLILALTDCADGDDCKGHILAAPMDNPLGLEGSTYVSIARSDPLDPLREKLPGFVPSDFEGKMALQAPLPTEITGDMEAFKEALLLFDEGADFLRSQLGYAQGETPLIPVASVVGAIEAEGYPAPEPVLTTAAQELRYRASGGPGPDYSVILKTCEDGTCEALLLEALFTGDPDALLAKARKAGRAGAFDTLGISPMKGLLTNSDTGLRYTLEGSAAMLSGAEGLQQGLSAWHAFLPTLAAVVAAGD